MIEPSCVFVSEIFQLSEALGILPLSGRVHRLPVSKLGNQFNGYRTGGDGDGRPCGKKARRRADGALRLSARARERRRAGGQPTWSVGEECRCRRPSPTCPALICAVYSDMPSFLNHSAIGRIAPPRSGHGRVLDHGNKKVYIDKFTIARLVKKRPFRVGGHPMHATISGGVISK
jgi:hypothetical protein